MPKIYTQEEISLAKLILKGYVFPKQVRKFGNNSGVIFVPRKWIGLKFKVILLPMDDMEDLTI